MGTKGNQNIIITKKNISNLINIRNAIIHFKFEENRTPYNFDTKKIITSRLFDQTIPKLSNSKKAKLPLNYVNICKQLIETIQPLAFSKYE